MAVSDVEDWELQFKGSSASTSVLNSPDTPVGLKNRYYNRYVKYGQQQFGVNLRLTPIHPGDNVLLVHSSNLTVLFGDLVAIHIAGDSWLRYSRRTWGVNLGWSNEPKYEWRITGGSYGAPVNTGQKIGLFNTVENDHLVGSWRAYGVNLAWAADVKEVSGQRRLPTPFWAGLYHSFTNAIVAVGNLATTVGSLVTTSLDKLLGGGLGLVGYLVDILEAFPVVGRLVEYVRNVILSLVWFFVSVPDFVLTLLGIMIEKRMRVHIIIQLDEGGAPVTTLAQVLPQLREAIRVFKAEANVRILPAQPQYTSAFSRIPEADTTYIEVATGASYTNTLNVACNAAGLGNDSLTSGSAFKLMIARNLISSWRRLTGYGGAVIVFGVRLFTDGHTGCSLGPLTDYVTLDFLRASVTTLAHELGHACYLWHYDAYPENLMYPELDRLTELDRFQKAILRSSRHVTFF
jgi:hypothetical protein